MRRRDIPKFNAKESSPEDILTLKQLERVNLTPSFGFSKNTSSRERAKPWFFVIFNIVKSHIFFYTSLLQRN